MTPPGRHPATVEPPRVLSLGDIRVSRFRPERDSFRDLTKLLNAAYTSLADAGLNYVAATQDVAVTAKRVEAASACWVAHAGEKLAGTICYYNGTRAEAAPEWYAREEVGYFAQFAVDPALQGCGIGALLMNVAEERALADGNLEFACDTAAPARRLVRFYHRRGFRVVGRHQWAHARYESVVLSKRLGITIRSATQADYPAIVAISDTTPWEKGDFLMHMLSRRAVDVACEGERIAGFNAWNRELFSKPMIWLIAVQPHERGKGIGSLLFSKAERDCSGSRLYASTNRSNVGMQRFYERRGYRACGELDLDPGDPEMFYCIDL
ncbi:MAG: GNAT family N-acetyltransferase [Candidatus Tumulicola sp.]